MPRLESELKEFYSTTDGMVTIKSGLRLGETELRDAQNIVYFPVGGFQVRDGYTKLNSTPVSSSPCSGLSMVRFSGGTNNAILIAGAKMYTMDNLDGTWDDKTGAVSITSGKNNLVSFAMLNDKVVMCNDTDTCWTLDSTLTSATLSGVPFTSALAVFEARGYMFYIQPVVSAVRQYDRAYFSDINDPNTVDSNKFMDVAKKNAGDLRGGVEYKGSVFFFKRHGIYRVDFQPTRVDSNGAIFEWIEIPRPIVPGVGLQSHRSIAKFSTPVTHKTPGQEIVFFVDQFGIPRLFDGISAMAVGASIESSRDENIESLDDMNKSRTPQIMAVNDYANKRIMCWMTSSGVTQHDTCWVLDYRVGFAWSRFDYHTDFNVAALFEKTDGTFAVYTGDYAGTVYELNSGTTDNGQDIEAYIDGPDMFFRSPVMKSNWRWLELRGTVDNNTQKIDLEYYKDGSDGADLAERDVDLFRTGGAWGDGGRWGENNWNGQGLETENKKIGLSAKTLRIRIKNKDNSHFIMEGYTVAGDPEGFQQE